MCSGTSLITNKEIITRPHKFDPHPVPDNLINFFLDEEMLMSLLGLCLDYRIRDNNQKAKISSKLLGPDYIELGTGTNRIAFLHNGVVVKVALDRRGLIDNLQEFKRSTEQRNYLSLTYETNFMLNVCEYVDIMDQETFIINEDGIKKILGILSQNYLFDDIGFTLKNSYNWGCRKAKPSDGYDDDDLDYAYDICILDYGYLYPFHSEAEKDRLLRCPICQHKLKWNANFTMLGCQNSNCHYQISPMNLRKHMDLEYDEMENEVLATFNEMKMPSLTKIEQLMTKIGI